MIEFGKHLIGICGEHWHPNIWTFLYSSPALLATFYYIRYKYKKYLKKII